MNREQLEHAVRAACEISGDNELYILGSQAILGQYPQADEQLRKSIEVDLSPKNKPEAVDRIDGAWSKFTLPSNPWLLCSRCFVRNSSVIGGLERAGNKSTGLHG